MKKATDDQTHDSTSPDAQNSLIKTKAATAIQAGARGFFARQRYCIRETDMFDLQKYPTFIVGNDPCMPKALSQYAEPIEKIALVGTSGLRSVSIACEMGQNLAHTPKIFIVDNSFEVHQFWLKFRTFMEEDQLTKTHALFSANLPKLLETTKEFCRQPSNQILQQTWCGSVEFPDQDASNFMQTIIEKHGYERFRATVRHVSLIRQSWEDRQTFTKLKNIINTLGINTVYAYPSNIVTLMSDYHIEDAMLRNIQQLSPKLSIHVQNGITDDGYMAPKEVKFIDNDQLKEARIVLGLN
jgi:hypothetical protein